MAFSAGHVQLQLMRAQMNSNSNGSQHPRRTTTQNAERAAAATAPIA
jgi:hypothetical protein